MAPTPVTEHTYLPAQTYQWRDWAIAYRQSGDAGPPVVLIHGFGASSLHWRKNLPVLGATFQVYALDLIGFGQSAKPNPDNFAYTFDHWAQLVLDFCQDIIGEPVFLVGNSIGCVVALQAAVTEPNRVRGLALLNCSLRQLHHRNREKLPWYQQWGVNLVQKFLAYPPLGHLFFASLAKPKAIRKILCQAYASADAVSDELIDIIYQPARDPGAADVFIAFITYSDGPLPEDLLAQITCPTLILWGEKDPWEDYRVGQEWVKFPGVKEFILLPGLGHCPQDQDPDVVNTYLQTFLADLALR
ncbi:alpha/beta fold hydrolase [Candidatus Synechococcus calcipolaris G9]|uniref:Alpha/beta fold hydrolase n=1 Tax=Candidatus Synechococcus calcipolaris G9 TaxID=1497997 RepID=A0ABT6F089_9SYNE|nr:alpha/beta fold hydrolase [Candidatus Synechococcus calcipolaris]MDG2991208.1 alpha/beta fold hydrolase [Candidatus Synechococcus calcipolaris G9]